MAVRITLSAAAPPHPAICVPDAEGGRALLYEGESITHTSLATGMDERPCRISDTGGFNQTAMTDKM